MLRTITVFALLIFTQFSQAQFICFPTDTLNLRERQDIWFNMQYMDNGGGTWKDSITLNPDLFNRLSQAYLAAKYTENAPYGIEVFGSSPINDVNGPGVNTVVISIDTNQAYARKMAGIQSFTPSPLLDSLNKIYGWKILSTYYKPSYNKILFTVKSTKPMFKPVLQARLNVLPGITQSNYNTNRQFAASGNNVYIANFPDSVRLIFNKGDGDCPSGCMIWKSYEFIITPDCKIFDHNYRPRAWTSIDETKSSQLAIFPNPVGSSFAINSDQEQAFILMDLSGRVVNEGVVSKSLPADISELSNGSYILKLGDNCIRLIKN